MALFGKNKYANESGFETELQFDNKSKSNSSESADVSNQTKAIQKNPPRSALNTNYGIQDAIKLVRKLPNVNTDIVISVVIKTLESAAIKVDEIIDDASQREARIEDRSSTLIAKIDELESQISELNKEITQLNSDLEETTTVKDLLLRSIAQDATKQSHGGGNNKGNQQQKSSSGGNNNNNKNHGNEKPKDSIAAAIDELALDKV